MKSCKFGDKIYEVDDQNFLIDYETWDENFAEGMAKKLSMPTVLSDKHWKVIHFIRDEFNRTGICPLVFQTCKTNDLTSKTLKNLFPTGYLRGACLLAGIAYKNRRVNYYGETIPKTEKPAKVKTAKKVYRVDVFGYLVQPTEWDEEFAFNKAFEMDIKLTDKHRKILHYLRDMYLKNRNIPNVFECCGDNEIEIDELEKLFPKGYHRCAVKIAGLPSIF